MKRFMSLMFVFAVVAVVFVGTTQAEASAAIPYCRNICGLDNSYCGPSSCYCGGGHFEWNPQDVTVVPCEWWCEDACEAW